ncbi:CBS domain-containing protein [Thalassotalea sp. PLHSN55]|uniref:CBS domain-containing protein n=1 Tax=Thalassotalea sp. PLHSN55 TaxID=3435888 RepID=UPI003F8454B6
MNHKLVLVKDAMNENSFYFADGMLTVAEGIQIAKEHNVSALIINKRHDHDEYGMVMLSDIAKHVVAKDRSPERTNLYEIMAKPLLSVSPDMDVRYCARLFEQFGLTCAPVIQNEEVLGMVDYTHMVLAQIDE